MSQDRDVVKSRLGRVMCPEPLSFTVHVDKRKSFSEVEAKAREVLKERGLTKKQIDAELKRARRKEDN
jgi:hypothetical protein